MKVGVVACSKTKAPGPAARPALELYRGRVFLASVALLRRWGCERFVVLSAQHFVLRDLDPVAPYERSLYDLPAAARRRWTETARDLLRERVFGLGDGPPDVHAIVPAAYAGALAGLPRVNRHFTGLPQGKLYSAVSRALEAAPP